jgi:SAM-dependent methyltransferase
MTDENENSASASMALAEAQQSDGERPPEIPEIVSGPQASESPSVASSADAPASTAEPLPATSRRLAPPPKPKHRESTQPDGPSSLAPRPTPAPVRIVEAAEGEAQSVRRSSQPPRPVSEPPRPTSDRPRAGSSPSLRAEPPKLADVPPPPALPSIPLDEVPTPARKIMAMRIIAVGESSIPPPPLDEMAISSKPPEAKPVDEPVASPPAPADDVEELADSDIAADSGPGVAAAVAASPATEASGAEAKAEPSEEGGRADAISLLPEEVAEEVAAADEAGASSASPASLKKKPPPPKRRPLPPPEALEEVHAERKRQRKPWWEELFGEDFHRAQRRLSDRQIEQEVSYIAESLGVAKGGVVLDLGCGAGHHAVELASRGFGVVGYDLSVFQLALAAEVAQERGQKINFLQGDMREMAFEETFDGIVCWNTSFGYFEEEKNANIAERMHKALKPGGTLLIDVTNRDFVAAQSPSQVWFEGDACVCMDDMSVDFITSRLRVKRSLILDDGSTRECNYSVRLYSLHELGKLLHEAGFRVAEASGHPSMPGVFMGQHSPRIIILAQKP